MTISEVISSLVKRKHPNIKLASTEHWIGNVKLGDVDYYKCLLCNEIIQRIPYDKWLEPDLAEAHALKHIKEYNLLILL